MFNKICEKLLPIYIRFWPSSYWIAFWSSFSKNETAWKALRITVRHGKNHSKIFFVLKKGII